MTISERLVRFREAMVRHGIDLYYVPTNDYHHSEYLDDYFKCREFLTGFTGSAGTLVVSAKEAGLWTDGRYFLQAEEQLAGTGITLYRMGEPDVPDVIDFLEDALCEGQCLGFDARVVNAAFAKKLEAVAEKKAASVNCSVDLPDEIWDGRPEMTVQPAYALDEKIAGEGRGEKLDRIRDWMQQKETDLLVLNSLDDIAWLLNIRGNDIHCSPVVMSYLVISLQRIILFARESSFSDKLKQDLTYDGVIFQDYDSIYDYLSQVKEGIQIAMDLRVVNYALLESVPEGAKVLDVMNPTQAWKAKKNPQEIAGEREAHIKDGVALVRFFCWLDKNVAETPLTEIRVAEKLEEFRAQECGYLGPSFDPIAAYGEHGAIVHYSASPETDAALLPENFLLLDTGAHYTEGTTDVTRTIFLGDHPSAEQKMHYTAVLRGNLRLAAAKFRQGCTGVTLDCLARGPLWEIGCDYLHGTGHGVGHLLNVHEGPNNISYQIAKKAGGNVAIEAGMITSDEPGIYLAGRYGIRLENLIVCVERDKTEFGQFLGFETLTMAPFDRRVIEPAQMTAEEIDWLNCYHAMVYDTISPYLNAEENAWLRDACAKIGNHCL